MAKVKIGLIKTRNVRKAVLDENGEPKLNSAGEPITAPGKGCIYGLIKPSPEALELFKKMQSQTGEDYYREIGGHPAYFTSKYFGKTAEAELVTLDNGDIVLSVDQTELDILAMEKESNPELAASLANKMFKMRSEGNLLKPLNTETFEEEDEEESEEESELTTGQLTDPESE